VPHTSLTLARGVSNLEAVDDDLREAIALATAWCAGDVDTWSMLADETIGGDARKVLRQMCFVIVQLAETVAGGSGGAWSAMTVLQHMALDAEDDED